MIVCTANSFLTAYRDPANCGDKSIFTILFGLLGILLSLISGFIIIFFFRNYEFDESNYLKRRYNFLIIL